MQIDILGNDALVQRLSLGMLDCAFMFDPLQTAGLEIKQIAEVPLRLYSTRPGIDTHKAMSRNYVMVDWGSAYGIIHAEKFPDLPPPALRTNSGEVAIGLLFDRGGAAYLPEAIGQAHMDAQRLFAVEHAPVINRLAYIVYRPECLDRTSMQQAMRALKGK